MEQRSRERAAVGVFALLALAMVPLILYIVGYYWLADVEQGYWMPERIPVVHRTYRAAWLAGVFEPAARLEERITGHEVEIGHSDEPSAP